MTIRLALVIGACNGAGYSTALCLAKSGFHIIGTYESLKERPADVSREIEWLGVSAVMLKLDLSLMDLRPFAQEVSEVLRQTYKADRLSHIIINTGSACDTPAAAVEIDHRRLCDMNIRLPHLLTEALSNILADAGDFTLISSFANRGLSHGSASSLSTTYRKAS
jgi:NAD(P)-dependent dehydrogenase (short-subunit alcohol dehydrogenase family)